MFKVKNPFKKNKVSWFTKIGFSFFYIQFLVAIIFFILELKKSCTILNQAVCYNSQDQIFFHYTQLVFLVPLIILSLLFALIEILSKHKFEFSFEQEIIEVFIFILWIGFAFLKLFS